MALQYQSRPEPMNATPHHSKVKASVTFSDPFFIAGDAVTGKMELESRADQGLGLGIIMVELVAIEELTSRDHSATSTFLQTRRLFQGPGLPPSNAVLPNPIAGEPPLPAHHYRARRGLTTFLFRLPLPPSSPSSVDFGNGLARIRYEIRASVSVAWKGQNRLVTDRYPIDVLQRYPGNGAAREEEGESYVDLWPAPESLVIGEGGKIWAQARVLGGILVAGESACIELQVKNHSSKKTTGLHLTLSRHLHLPSPANNTSKRLPPPLQISDALESVSFRGPEYIAHPGTEGIAQLAFDVPYTARTVSAHPRDGGDTVEDREKLVVVKGKTPALFEVRGVVAVRIVMPLGSKDIVLELPVAVFHPATLPPPQPEPYPYPAPDIYSNPYPNYGSSPSPSPPFPVAAPLATPMPYAERAQSPLYAYPMTPPPLLPLLSSSVPAPLNAQLVIPPYKAYDGQLWFPPPPPTYVGGPLYNQAPPPRPASANVGATLASVSTSGLPISGTPDHLRHPFSYQPQQYYPPQPEQTTGHGTRAARISHHLRATSRARSVSPPPLQLPLPTEVEVEVLAPKPMPSPKIVPEMHGVGGSGDPFAQSFGRIGTRARSLSVVKLEEMAARAAAETEAEARGEKVERETAALDKTLPVPPVPSGKPIGYGVNRRLIAAQEIFHQREPDQEERGSAPEGIIGAQADVVPRTPPLSALSLLRPPPLHDQPAFLSYGERGNGESGLDALERRLAGQVGTRKRPPPPLPLPPSDVHTQAALARATTPVPPPPPFPAPVSVPGKKSKSLTQERHANDDDDDVNVGAAVNESAISSLALGADEDFGGRVNAIEIVNTRPSLEGEGEEEDVEGEDVDADADADVDADADGRTQRQGKGAGASSGSERGTHKARSHESTKSDSKEKDKDRDKERRGKKKRDKRDTRRVEEATRLRRAAKGRIEEWLGKLGAPESGAESGPEREEETITLGARAGSDAPARLLPLSSLELPTSAPSPLEHVAVPVPTHAANQPEQQQQQSPTIVESKPNPRSSGFVPVATLRRAPISLPPAPAPTFASVLAPAPGPNSTSTATATAAPAPGSAWHLVGKYPPPPPQLEMMKYDVKSARGGRGGRVTAVAAIWAEAAKASNDVNVDTIASKPTHQVKAGGPPAKGKGNVNAAKPAGAGMEIGAGANKLVPPSISTPIKPVLSKVPRLKQTVPSTTTAKDVDKRAGIKKPATGASASAVKEKDNNNTAAPPRLLPRGAIFGLGIAAAATPSSPALSSSIATPVLSSTASLARPPLVPTSAPAPLLPMAPRHDHDIGIGIGNKSDTPPPPPPPPFSSSSSSSSPRPPPPLPQSQQPEQSQSATGHPIVGGGGFRAELAFGQARLRDLIRRYQGQAA